VIVWKLAELYFFSVNVRRHRKASRLGAPHGPCKRFAFAKGTSWENLRKRLGRPVRCLLGWSAIATLPVIFATACATRGDQIPLTSTLAVQYYPFQVKGYQNTYPKRTLVVLLPVDSRDFKETSGAAHSPVDGSPAVGVIRDQSGEIIQRLYGPAMEPLVQQSITQAAQEAGMNSLSSNVPFNEALGSHPAQYLVTTKIVRFWVDKHRGPDDSAGATWSATAEVVLDVAVYKPPFNVPFWQGESSATYSDPPAPVAGVAPEDDTEIYDDPGQVLSVGLTRAAAGIFRREDLHTLIAEDSALTQ
jgi:hypothetical protein